MAGESTHEQLEEQGARGRGADRGVAVIKARGRLATEAP
jgi:hypothetical protein